jgi:aryl-alcohol dehydrogenase-like predicted oxidoreductase
VAALDELKRAGKIKSFGASNFEPDRFSEGIAEAKKRGLRFEAQQPEYNLMNRAIEAELMPLCEREGIAIFPYFALASGYLTGKYRSEADKAKSARGPRMDKYLSGKGPAVLAALDEVSARHGATQAQIALAWIMAKPAIGAPIASATSVTQLKELMGALDVALSAEDVAALDKASA